VFMRSGLIFLVSFVAASTAHASSKVSDGFAGLKIGMNKEQVQAAFPKGSVSKKTYQLIANCDTSIVVNYKNDFVNVLQLSGTGALLGKCSEEVFSYLSSIYGPPTLTQKYKSGGLLPRPGKESIWSAEGLELKYINYNDNGFGGGGLLQTSWRVLLYRVK
jgi:hypothetical protein